MSDLPLVPNLSSDRPISSLSEDFLGRGGFAVALANAFIQWRGEDSLVVALYGPWGSGKSSLKNMVLEMIQRHEDRPAIIEFNPWAWSGRDGLFSAFFDEVGIAIGKGSDSSEAKKLASRWRKYGARLSFAGTAIAAIKNGTQALGIPMVPLVLEGVASAAQQGSKLAEGAAKVHEANSEEEPLDDLKRSLAEALRGLTVPMLVVMDDVDRLTKEEIRLLFQLIKVNADFPNVVYFLLFDRQVIEKALDGQAGTSGRDYMEKIVQAGFDLPKHDQNDLDAMLGQGLNRLLSFQGAERTFEADRWAKLHQFGIRRLLGTPRDVNRFLSSLSFTVGLFYREGALEVNVIDLIGMEALRVFEPDLYHALPGQRELLFGAGPSHLFGGNSGQDRRVRFEKFIQQVSETNRAAVTAILRELFQSFDWLLSGYGEGQGFEAGWMRSLRVCHRDIFDRYFALAVPKGDLSLSLIDRLIAAIKDRSQIRRELEELRDSGRLGKVLNRILVYTSVLDLGGAVSFVTAIMDVGDSLAHQGTGIFGLSPDMTAYFLIYEFLKREQDPGERSRILLEALSATDGLYLPQLIISQEEKHRGSRDNHVPLLHDDESWSRATRLCVDKLKRGAEDGRLLGPKLRIYLWRWKVLAGDSAPRRFANTLTSTMSGAIQFLRGFLVELRSQTLGSVTTHVSPTINAKEVEYFVSMARLRSRLKPLLAADIPAELASVAAEYGRELAAFKMALDLRQGGDSSQGYEFSGFASIDINTASLSELVHLPGINLELAQRIIDHRPYQTVDEIKSVKGISKTRFSKLGGRIKA